ncbi:MAG TPA: hypothetical protein VMU22_12595 [Rhizomicrobium sp.]|nr:hypothetical protein [Rhizomicrobium sp.]
MRTLLASTGAALCLILCAGVGAPADAESLATRCGPQGCDHIKCHNDGTFCVRYSDYDPRYNGYIGAGYYVNGYGGYGGYGSYGGYGGYGGYYGGRYIGNEYAGTGAFNGHRYVGNEYAGTGIFSRYGNGYYGGYGGYYGGYGAGLHFVCDPDGDRCYSTTAPFWDYREYYRRHGYHWDY